MAKVTKIGRRNDWHRGDRNGNRRGTPQSGTDRHWRCPPLKTQREIKLQSRSPKTARTIKPQSRSPKTPRKINPQSRAVWGVVLRLFLRRLLLRLRLRLRIRLVWPLKHPSFSQTYGRRSIGCTIPQQRLAIRDQPAATKRQRHRWQFATRRDDPARLPRQSRGHSRREG